MGGRPAPDAALGHSGQRHGAGVRQGGAGSLGLGAHVLGALIHFIFAAAWGVLFAVMWPFFRRRGWEATLLALFYAVFVWIVMHAAIALVSSSHPNDLDPVVIIGGFMSHFFFTVPLALVVKRGMELA